MKEKERLKTLASGLTFGGGITSFGGSCWMLPRKLKEIVMPQENRWSASRLATLLGVLLVGLIAFFVVARPDGGALIRRCATTPVPATGVPVPAGAVAVPITTPPTVIAAGTTCAAGDTATAPGAVCGIWGGGYTCKDTYNTVSGACSLECM